MARYKAEQALFVGETYVYAGEEFESDLPPGRYWTPLDDAAKQAASARPKHTNPRDAAIAAEREKRKAVGGDVQDTADADADNTSKRSGKRGRPTGLKGRKNGVRTPDASSAKDRPPTPGKPVAEQQTDGEEPTRD